MNWIHQKLSWGLFFVINKVQLARNKTIHQRCVVSGKGANITKSYVIHEAIAVAKGKQARRIILLFHGDDYMVYEALDVGAFFKGATAHRVDTRGKKVVYGASKVLGDGFLWNDELDMRERAHTPQDAEELWKQRVQKHIDSGFTIHDVTEQTHEQIRHNILTGSGICGQTPPKMREKSVREYFETIERHHAALAQTA